MEHLGKLKLTNMGQAMGQLFPLLGLITVIKQAMPHEGHQALSHLRSVLRNLLNPFCFLTVNEFEGSLPNQLYSDIHSHLESCKAYNRAKRVTVFRPPKSTSITMRLSNSDDVIVDTYKGMTVWWTHYVDTNEKQYRSPYGGQSGPTTREFQLRVRKKDRARLLPEYLNFIAESSATYTSKTRDIKIFNNSRNSQGGFRQYTLSGTRRLWEEVPYKHPSTFQTLAMEPSLKDNILADLIAFTTDKEFYERTGRAWKRGYLLYGPPGTGKSSMIAAMANFLKYDIYDLELSQVRTNGKLRELLLQTSNRSIIVLEDIDCSVKFTSSRSSKAKTSRSTMSMPGDVTEDNSNKVTLSGLLNFVDGLWSCCGDGRIFVFTTNHIEKLDKALLRPGRMDMQIELSYCTFPSFRVLAHNYLSVQDHPLFEKIEAAFVGKTLTPAQIAEILIKDKSDVDIALESVLSALENNVPEAEADTTTTTTDDHGVNSRDSATVSEDDEASKHDDPGMCNGSAKDVSKEDLISVLQGVIEALENNPEILASPCRQTAASRANRIQA